MSWTWDAPTGTYRSHEMSSKIREQAAADSFFMRFMDPEPGYGKKKGDSVTITRILQLPLAGKVGETDRLPSARPAISTKSVRTTNSARCRAGDIGRSEMWPNHHNKAAAGTSSKIK